uniref:Uncharacterized protein n=1 Tax=Adineta vaga TaxID=104782 RepID=D4NWE3_ADIVA|nr:hypothetical protein [Adineta vaga]
MFYFIVLEIKFSMDEPFRYFQQHRIDEQLLKTPSFVKALQLIETTIANPNLSVKFAQTCVPTLRNEPLFDLTESLKHILTIYQHQVIVLQNINLKIDSFADNWSIFSLGHRRSSSFDEITLNRSLINGSIDIDTNDIETYSRLAFFFYAKLLHEVAHACLAEMGRQMPHGDYDERFSSPATHALAGEAGDSIERHFFGSVVDVVGDYTNTEKNIFKIDHVILREKRSKQVVTNDYLLSFNKLNLALIKSIPTIVTKNLPSVASVTQNQSPKRKRKSK